MSITAQWTTKDEEQLKELIDRGLSAGQIAAEMNRTRNAIIGKAARKGWQIGSRGRPPVAVKRARVYVPRNPKRTRAARIVAQAQEMKEAITEQRFEAATAFNVEAFTAVQQSQPITLMALQEGDCKWPIGDGFCGCKAMAGKPYCVHHSVLSVDRTARIIRKEGDPRRAANWKAW